MQSEVYEFMRDLCDKLERYLYDALGIRVAVVLWETEGSMSLFLQDRYRFFRAAVLNQKCLFMVDVHAEEESPAAIRKHVEQVPGKWDGPVVYVRDRIMAYNRKRLIEHKVSFIVPGTQMYLPTLGIDLREHFRRFREEKRSLRPAAQAVLIHALLRDAGNLGPTALAGILGYSVMAMSRALDDLETAELGQTTINGRERCLCLAGPKHEVWGKAQPLLRSPVVKCHAISVAPNAELSGSRAGLDALTHYTMLAEPRNSVVALGRESWKVFQQADGVKRAMNDEPGAVTVEVWSYKPVLFAEGGWVDRLSLYLSLREVQDERVQAALDQMVKEVSW